jgi:hypothetical protein
MLRPGTAITISKCSRKSLHKAALSRGFANDTLGRSSIELKVRCDEDDSGYNFGFDRGMKSVAKGV